MKELDPYYNCITSNNILKPNTSLKTTSIIIKSNANYAKGLSLMHLNVRSIPKNIDKLNNYLLLLDIQFSIIGLTETWLKKETSELYEHSEYKSIHVTNIDPPEKEEEYRYTFTKL